MIEQLESELRSALRARADELPGGTGARVRARDYRPRTRDLPPPVAAGALVAAAAAAAGVLLVDLGPRTPEAFAGWTAAPTHASAAQVADAKGDCGSRLSDFSTRSGKAMKAAGIKSLPTISQMTPVLTDTRGPFTFVIYSGPNGATGTCISGPSFTSLSTRSGGATEPPAGKIVASFEAHTAHAQDAYSFVEGHAGDGVTAATLILSDGSQVQTTIQNGWLVAWWPGSAAVTSARVTTASGTTTQHLETQPVGRCPQPPAGATTPKDVACSSAGFAGGQGQGQAAGSMSMLNRAGGGQPPAGGGPVTSIRKSGQVQGTGTVTGSNGG
ncbi:MAG: hypothetical protein ACXVRW_00965 [Solirubrobacteraceae bacterium]